jgi:hypothetical protein
LFTYLLLFHLTLILDVVAFLANCNCTISQAKKVAMRTLRGNQQSLAGYRQPVGSIKRICGDIHCGNLSKEGYKADKPTIVILNCGNAHWKPVAVGSSAITVIYPDSPLRANVDALLK